MSDVIICLGDTFTKAEYIKAMKLRAKKAAEIFNKQKIKKIIFTGGFKTRKDLSEAKFMAEHAIRSGVPKTSVILEEKANTTIENALYSKKIMERENFKSAIVITSPWHLKRTQYIFKQIMPKVKIVFEKSKNNLGLIGKIRHFVDEQKSLINLKRKDINL